MIIKKDYFPSIHPLCFICRESKRKEKKHVEGKKVQELNNYLW